MVSEDVTEREGSDICNHHFTSLCDVTLHEIIEKSLISELTLSVFFFFSVMEVPFTFLLEKQLKSSRRAQAIKK